jgi:hypothetical protein
LEDIYRTSARPFGPVENLELNRQKTFLILLDEPITQVPIWNRHSKDVELIKDYGTRFRSLIQIAEHWYGSESYPRFLYRFKTKEKTP